MGKAFYGSGYMMANSLVVFSRASSLRCGDEAFKHYTKASA